MFSEFRLPVMDPEQCAAIESCFEIITTGDEFRKALSDYSYIWFRKGRDQTRYEYRMLRTGNLVIKDTGFATFGFANFHIDRFPCDFSETFLILREPDRLGMIILT